jgi:hypothetical protein
MKHSLVIGALVLSMLSSTTFGAKKRSNQVGLYPAAFKDLSTLSNPTIWNWLEKAT